MRPPALTGLSSLPGEFVASLPDVAIIVGLLALIWLACAVIATVGLYLAGMIFSGARWLVRTCRRTIHRHWKPPYAHLVMIDSTGVRVRPVTARRARRWHTPPATTAATVNGEPATEHTVEPNSDRHPDTDSGGEPS